MERDQGITGSARSVKIGQASASDTQQSSELHFFRATATTGSSGFVEKAGNCCRNSFGNMRIRHSASAVQLREISHFQDAIGASPGFDFEMGMGGRDGHCAHPILCTQSKGSIMPTSEPNRSLLLPQHQKLIEDSGISDSIAQARGYRSLSTEQGIAPARLAKNQQLFPALLLPNWAITAEVSLYQVKPDNPRSIHGKVVKYENPFGVRLSIDVPPTVRGKVLTGREPLFVTDGIEKADAAVSHGLTCIGLMGVYGWKNQDEFWKLIPLNQRMVYIVFDSDITTNRSVATAAVDLAVHVKSMGAKPYLVTLPADSNKKVGLNDFLKAQGTPSRLYSLAKAL